MNISRLEEIKHRFTVCKELQKANQMELVNMRFTEHEIKEIIDIIGDLIFIKKNEAIIAKAISASTYGNALPI